MSENLNHSQNPIRDITQLPLEIEPIYFTKTANDPIVLYEDELELEQDDESLSGFGSITLKWLPTPHFHFEIPHGTPALQVKLVAALLKTKRCNDPIKVHITKSYGGILPAYAGSVAGTIADTAELLDDRMISSVLFHVPNFHSYIGSPVRNQNGSAARSARAIFEGNGLRVTMDSVHILDRKLKNELRDSGGYAITHVGKLERIDGQLFKSENAKGHLESIAYFLSFCRGAWVAPILAVGLDGHGNHVWKEWRNWSIDRWQSVRTWFNLLTPEGLSQAFPGFIRRQNDALWDETLRVVLHWYLECNRQAGGIEGSVILAQAAFELLAWTFLVEEKKILSKDGFDKIQASDKLRLLLSSCGIPLKIPPSLVELIALAKSSGWKDGPQALTGLRNALVHPNVKKVEKVLKTDLLARHNAWSLALWYLELILLHQFEYRSSYSNRLISNCSRGEEVESVPWAT